MTRPAGPFAAPPPKKPKAAKRDTPDEAAEKRYVRQRDKGCVGPRAMRGSEEWRWVSDRAGRECDGPLEVDHVRASGGLGIKSSTHRTNMVCLCRHHHRLKTEYGRTWRPLLLAYLERVER